MNWKIPLFKIYWDKEDVKSVTKVIQSGMNWATGPNIKKFEKIVSEYLDGRYTLTFNSGTSALHALMRAYNINEGDEVIIPSFSFIATANAPLFVGAKPVFADIEEISFGLRPKDIENKITKKTKAIIPIHYGGCSCKIEEIKKIAEKHNLLLIEDSAESLGAKFKGKKTGTFGNAAMFSLCAPKVITTGEGGIAVTDSKEIYEKLKLIRSHGRLENINYFASAKKMDYITLGYNFRISNILAALGISQFKKIDEIIKKRRENANYLTNKLKEIKKIILPSAPENYYHIYQMYTIRIKGKNKKTRDNLKKYLEKKGIMTKIYFEPIHLASFYKKNFGFKEGYLPTTEKISEQVLTLPMYPSLTKKEMDYIIKNIKKFFKKNG